MKKSEDKLTLPVDVRVLVVGLVVSDAQRVQSKVGHFEHETAVDHAVARLEIAVRPDFRRMDVGHGLRDEKRKYAQKETQE